MPTQASQQSIYNRATAKHKVVRKALQDAIFEGVYSSGSKIPAERDLAAQYGVSLPTARQAVSELVLSRILERRGRQGTYVSALGSERLNTATVNLICPGQDHPVSDEFRRTAKKMIFESGRTPRLLWFRSGCEEEIFQLLDRGELAIFLFCPSIDNEAACIEEPLIHAMRAANGRAVVIGNIYDNVGIPSVVADDAQGIRLAIMRLREAGRKRIAMVTDQPDHPVARIQVAAWRSWSPPQNFDARLISVRTPGDESLGVRIYERVREYLRSPVGRDVDAIVGGTRPAAILAACRDENRRVPEEISLIDNGNSTEAMFASPAVTVIDVNVEQHVRYAIDFLDTAGQTRAAGDLLRMVEPKLIERHSV